MNSEDRIPSLDEEAGYPLTDDPEVVTEADIDWVAEIDEADELAVHNAHERVYYGSAHD